MLLCACPLALSSSLREGLRGQALCRPLTHAQRQRQRPVAVRSAAAQQLGEAQRPSPSRGADGGMPEAEEHGHWLCSASWAKGASLNGGERARRLVAVCWCWLAPSGGRRWLRWMSAACWSAASDGGRLAHRGGLLDLGRPDRGGVRGCVCCAGGAGVQPDRRQLLAASFPACACVIPGGASWRQVDSLSITRSNYARVDTELVPIREKIVPKYVRLR